MRKNTNVNNTPAWRDNKERILKEMTKERTGLSETKINPWFLLLLLGNMVLTTHSALHPTFIEGLGREASDCLFYMMGVIGLIAPFGYIFLEVNNNLKYNYELLVSEYLMRGRSLEEARKLAKRK